jgi:hypothetical protein
MITLKRIKLHLFGRAYMSGVERDQSRIKSTGEVFTPADAVSKMLDTIPVEFFTDPTKTALDPACGDGNWLAEVLWRKLNSDFNLKQALSTIHGLDIMEDNVIECRRRLLCGQTDPELVKIVNLNIVCADALRYHGRFDGTPPYDEIKPVVKNKKVKINNTQVDDLFSQPIDTLYTQ